MDVGFELSDSFVSKSYEKSVIGSRDVSSDFSKELYPN